MHADGAAGAADPAAVEAVGGPQLLPGRGAGQHPLRPGRARLPGGAHRPAPARCPNRLPALGACMTELCSGIECTLILLRRLQAFPAKY